MSDAPANASALRHCAAQLPGIMVDTYNADLRDAEGFVGDRASRRAIRSPSGGLAGAAAQIRTGGSAGRDTSSRTQEKLDKVLLGQPTGRACPSAAPAFFSKLKVMPR
jgi:hypothetical protein